MGRDNFGVKNYNDLSQDIMGQKLNEEEDDMNSRLVPKSVKGIGPK